MLGQSVTLAGAALLGVSCAGRSTSSAPLQQNRRRFARVLVAPDRVVRTVAGLRPFRKSGFVVRLAKYDDKPVVHNYGHGGGGISLSWGSAALALELVEQTGYKRVAVLGSGVMG